jgi:uncharacterized protein YoxC
MRIDIYHHFAAPDDEIKARLVAIQSAVNGLSTKGNTIMATTAELLDAVTALAAAFEPLPAAIDALEAAVAAIPGIPAADQANIDKALAAVKSLTAGVVDAVADATNGPDAPTE